MLRGLAIAAGCLIIAATAHVVIVSTGGYGMPTAPLQIAVALGLIVGSVCVGTSLCDRRWLLAIVFVCALVAGEAYSIIVTSETVIVARDAAAAPIRGAEKARAEAVQRVGSAEVAKVEADHAALTEAAKRHCASNCRKLLEDAKADAQRELNAARAALAALPQPRSAAPLADRLHIAGWTLDLITAALRSIAANGLGAALIAFGAHKGRRESREVQSIEAVTARDHAVKFALETLSPGDASTPVANLHSAYVAWCRAKAQQPFPPREIGKALLELFGRTGVEIGDIDGQPHVLRAKIKTDSPGALGHMTTIGVHA